MNYTALRITVAKNATFVARDKITGLVRLDASTFLERSRQPEHALRIEDDRVVWEEHREGGRMAPFEGSLDQLVRLMRDEGGFVEGPV